jgi:large subunit ribosomal protein L13
MKTMIPRVSEIERKWFLVDAEGQTLGRMASNIASILKGKHKPIFTPHMDTGDHVVVVNIDKVHVTGKKMDDRIYFRHSQYPGGASYTKMKDIMSTHPERLLMLAVKGMLPKTKLGRAMITKLKVYAGAEHPHAAQQPVKVSLTHMGGTKTEA